MNILPAENCALAFNPPNFSCRPKRVHLEQLMAIKGYGKLMIRPICPEDEEKMIRFHARLSEESIYMRYFEYLGLDQRASHERLKGICSNSADSFALVVELLVTLRRSFPEILAVGRLSRTSQSGVATFDMLLNEDERDGKIGKALLGRLVKFAQAFDFHTIYSDLLVSDHGCQNLCRSFGFSLVTQRSGGMVRVTLNLSNKGKRVPLRFQWNK